jgi:hypothetical protein
MAKQKLTSVKVNESLFDDFKIESIKSFMNFQKLCDRSLYLYLNDEEFKKKIHSTNETEAL